MLTLFRNILKTRTTGNLTGTRITRIAFPLHIGGSWGLHETTGGRIVRKVENLLVQCGKFRLPSQRQLYQPGWEWKVMVVDVAEMEIEPRQKNRNATTGLSTKD